MGSRESVRHFVSNNATSIVLVIAAASLGWYRLAEAEDEITTQARHIVILERNQFELDRSQREVEAGVATIRRQVNAVADAVGAQRTDEVPLRPSELERPPE